MPVRPPALDDRAFEDLVADLVSRIPAHTPEWTNPRPGDPGRTLIDLFAWLGEALLYRVNLIPERQRLAFLRLLGEGMRPATPATGLIALTAREEQTEAVKLPPRLRVLKPQPFETRSELTVLPVTAEAFVKRPVTDTELAALAEVVDGLAGAYEIDGTPRPYVTHPVFADGLADVAGIELFDGATTIDRTLWLALLAPNRESLEAVRQTLGGRDDGAARLINVGIAPAIEVPEPLVDVGGERAAVPHVWEMLSGTGGDGAVYTELEPVGDSTKGLRRTGVIRLALPLATQIVSLEADQNAGVGNRPPRLDDPQKSARLVSWIRLRAKAGVERLSLSWVGVNAVEIEGRLTQPARIVGLGDGRAHQEVGLGVTSVDPVALDVQVEDERGVFRRWTGSDDLLTAGRDERRYQLDPEAGAIRFGDGMRGARPTEGGRIRVDGLRSGGGTAWNLPAGTLTAIEAVDLDRRPVTGLKIRQPLATTGGEDAETLDAAERRIPSQVRHGDRAVTTSDYQDLAATTPGVRLGRVEVLPLFKPHQRRTGVPGVVSVMIVPRADGLTPPNPRADRPTIERVFAHLDERRPLGTELYVIGSAYVPLAVSAGVTLRDGVDRDVARRDIAMAIRRFLWPLAPGGSEETGWPLGRTVTDRAVEVVVARVPQVREVRGITLFGRANDAWRARTPDFGNGPASVTLESWELPELLHVAVAVDADPPSDPTAGEPDPFGDPNGVGVPVLPEVC